MTGPEAISISPPLTLPTFSVFQSWPYPPLFLASLASHVLSIASGKSNLIDLQGANREVKKAVEAYWAGKISAEELTKAASEVKKSNWTSIKAQGVDFVPSGDFTLYDHVLDHSAAFNVIPKRYTGHGLSDLDIYFAMGRGRQAEGVDVPASEMKKWFDSNYHFVVPEFSDETDFKLNFNKALEEFKEAKALGVATRPVVLGPVSYLVLGKASKDAKPDFKPISLLPKLLPIYEDLLSALKEEGAEWVQIDEPILVLDVAATLEKEYATAYAALSKVAPKIMLTTYFNRLDSNVKFIAQLPVAGLHIDLDRAPGQLDEVVAAIKPTNIVLSLGVVSGRNIWKTDFDAAIKLGQKAVDALGAERVVIATSSSLLHTPVTLASEKKLTEEQRDWFSFATEKAGEVATIAAVLSGSQAPEVSAALEANKASIAKRRAFEKNSDDAVRKRVAAITDAMLERQSPFAVRKEVQAKHLNLPKFPTTTIGSFPQTKEIRQARAKLGKGEITEAEYEDFIKKEIQSVVDFQEKVGLDLFVHGEPERNDMVQYFGEQLSGFVFTQNAWVQSYGSRYVRPPIIVSDVSRPNPMTVKWSSYAQSLTKKPMKGMLTGPVTILNWSFPRADVSRELQSKQLALALRDEVVDLEKAGISAIQVDEPAIREGLPLRRSDWDEYLKWAVDSFKLSTAGVTDKLQTHSHFCYSDFDDIFPSIQRLDADVISIEASKSDMKLISTFKRYGYSNQIGPGVYDIHSPRVPGNQEIKDRLKDMLTILPDSLLFVNPDCGLKTRGWKETEASLQNLVEGARWARENYA
ncbi:cobalamin-independent methionine synthase [Cylindrobasidium torrendii FP15055 ss-10]|uniref:5-methyltetrahydropteroyltriglutamate--homocysteine S-methyltransferase n=1 Tax=Cylindrobasidium torrendii FP15055 ss-10 TaxID=1314674 RepID=A0A0D7BU01_9AGAR|nr:cobalamin-independent methionine synthase [Cylindrobasidium torrendii FP15055 ss-10]